MYVCVCGVCLSRWLSGACSISKGDSAFRPKGAIGRTVSRLMSAEALI